ncbi:hypothetical protein U8607_05405 [Methylobacterium durans]|nr:hypothetical protein [Methylobacterium durans]MEA1831516.1 hypothetical protein [Methylobacterium durans]
MKIRLVVRAADAMTPRSHTLDLKVLQTTSDTDIAVDFHLLA